MQLRIFWAHENIERPKLRLKLIQETQFCIMTKILNRADHFLSLKIVYGDMQNMAVPSIELGNSIITPDGSTRLFGLPKIYKALVYGFPKYRPNISQILSPTFTIAKYLLHFYYPSLKMNTGLKINFSVCSWLLTGS